MFVISVTFDCPDRLIGKKNRDLKKKYFFDFSFFVVNFEPTVRKCIDYVRVNKAGAKNGPVGLKRLVWK